jgi:hypothetical protein
MAVRWHTALPIMCDAMKHFGRRKSLLVDSILAGCQGLLSPLGDKLGETALLVPQGRDFVDQCV